MAKKYLTVKVQTKAPKQGIERLGHGEYKISVKSLPSGGKANREVIEVIASHFDLPLSGVKIVRGEKSRQKLIALDIDDRMG